VKNNVQIESQYLHMVVLSIIFLKKFFISLIILFNIYSNTVYYLLYIYKVPDGRIIIYGGSKDPYKIAIKAISDLAVLNT